ncbi:MAG TPA: hypothetical protein V6C57_18010, partial [Coleofasciculaceae cyanobacterium]
EQLTPQASIYTPFLTPAYAQSFSTADLKLRLNSDLPPNFSNWLKMAALPMEQLVSSTLPKRAERSCNRSLICFSDKLPLVMFILPGGIPLAASQFFKLKRQKRRRQRRSP